MITDLYDEFGNYIGPEVNDSESESPVQSEPEDSQEESLEFNEEEDHPMTGENEEEVEEERDYSTAIILPEEKQYYPDAEEVYGDAEVLVQEEDEQDISVPLIAPIDTKTFSLLEKTIPVTNYSNEYHASIMNSPDHIRNVAVLGNLQHGKTSFVDMLIESTHAKKWPLDSDIHYTDTLKAEQDRHISIQSTPVSLLLEDSGSHPYILNLIDCPGHTNFSGEITAALRLVDGVLLCVDVIEGVMMQTERCLRHVVDHHLPLIVVFTKMDRLITELRLPPSDAYLKIKAMLEKINGIIKSASHSSSSTIINPIENNVIFSSAKHRWCFSLLSYANKYCSNLKKVTASAFARRLWGDLTYDASTHRFQRLSGMEERSFVQLCLNPIYKLYSQVMGESPEALKLVLNSLRIHLTKTELALNASSLLRRVMSAFFESHACVVDSVSTLVPSPLEGNRLKVEQYYTGDLTSSIAQSMIACSAEGPLVMNITKMYPTPKGDSFLAFGRILSGTLVPGESVDVLGETYIPEDTEDIVHTTVTSISIPEGRYTIEINKACAGSLVLLRGLSDAMIRTATVVRSNTEEAHIFKPLEFFTKSLVCIAIEPLRPSELQKMTDGLTSVCKAYPLINTRVEENGSHILIGTGEMQIDCAMYDLRELYSHIEIKVSNPFVNFCETVVDSSALMCSAETGSISSGRQRSKLMMLAEPLEKGLAKDIEEGILTMDSPMKERCQFLEEVYKWDRLASRGLWAFGPDLQGPNVLIDDTTSDTVDKELLYDVRNSIIKGFQWGCREGPLCEEPIRNVKFRLTGAELAAQANYRNAGLIIPTTRRVVYSSFLHASPRLCEPFYEVEIQIPAVVKDMNGEKSMDIRDTCNDLLSHRRGYIQREEYKAGTPFRSLQAFIPIMDSFGFETELRVATSGAAFPQFMFSDWKIVPGDPLDKNVMLIANEPAQGPSLARDFMVKSRRRKGLSEDVRETKFDDESMLQDRNDQMIEERLM